MFSSDPQLPRDNQTPLLHAVSLALPFFLAVLLPILSGRLTIVGWALIALAAFVVALGQRELRPATLKIGWVEVSILVFCTFTALSALWAAEPIPPLGSGLTLLAVSAATIWIIHTIPHFPRRALLHMTEGIWLALLIGLIYFLFEELSGHVIKIAVVNALGLQPGEIKPAEYYVWKNEELVRIKSNVMTRNTALIPLVLWPAMLAAMAILRRPYNLVLAASLFALSVFAIVISPHETSKVAIVVGVALFALAVVSGRWARHTLSALWVGACLLILPFVFMVDDLRLHETSKWFDRHAKSRVGIWSLTAEKTLDAPILGVGARMTYKLGPEFMETADEAQLIKNGVKRRMSRHAHNAYLQTWYELGAVGALLLALVGLSIIKRMAHLPARLQPVACATFASCAVAAGLSYGMWQTWFMMLFAVAAIALFVAFHAWRTFGATKPDS